MLKYDKYIINSPHDIKNPFKSRIYEQIAKYLTPDNSAVHNSNANDMRVTQDLNSFGEIQWNKPGYA
jgi:hypothetical protein